ncbi:hypothetical protein P3T73_05630 [Kiritimatiellota bacterium B12222]|nr:hypothetical protein P3T73_05630 [Kiritimatiellota bacterium B12222]
MKKMILMFMFVGVGLLQAETPWTVIVEGGPVWFSRNDVAVPGDAGTQFNLLDLTGDGPDLAARLMVERRINKRHHVRLTLAPISAEGTGTLSQDVLFKSTVFTPDAPTKAVYEFNTYRLGYRYDWRDDEKWELGAGVSLLLRDAKIQLSQGGVTETEEDLGLVPLLNFYTRYSLNQELALVFDLLGAAAPQGRAIDAGLFLRWQGNEDWFTSLGVRSIEGGADNDSVYTFAWLTTVALQVGYTF